MIDQFLSINIAIINDDNVEEFLCLNVSIAMSNFLDET